MYLIQKIEELMMNYSDARHMVGEFVLHERATLYTYTIDEIAKLTYTSKATVVRFAQTLGYSGWKDFMKAFNTEVRYIEHHQHDVDANYPFHEKSTIQDIMERMQTLQIESIKDSGELMDVTMIEKAVHYLSNAKRIVIFGLSPNIFLGELFRRKMITIGKHVEIARSGESGIISRTMCEEDCAIMISYSGNNEKSDPLCHVELLLEHGVSLIAMTSGGDNYLRKHANCALTISSKERLYTKIANFASEESLQYIFNVLFSCYYAKNFQGNNQFKIQNSKVLEQERYTILHDIKDE